MTDPTAPAPRAAIIVMGVSGCGKTSVGEGIAAHLAAPFVEGDALHPAANIRKMEAGTALTDADRWPWLHTIAARIAAEPGPRIVVSCSSLRRSYRDLLRDHAGRPVTFIYLHGSEALLAARMGARTGHFMPPALLTSQLATLEDPRGEPGVVTIDIAPPVAQIVADALTALAGRVNLVNLD